MVLTHKEDYMKTAYLILQRVEGDSYQPVTLFEEQETAEQFVTECNALGDSDDNEEYVYTPLNLWKDFKEISEHYATKFSAPARFIN